MTTILTNEYQVGVSQELKMQEEESLKSPYSEDCMDEIESKMREEIKALQERKNTVLLRQLADLKLHREKAMRKIANLEATVSDLEDQKEAFRLDADVHLESLKRTLAMEQQEKELLRKQLGAATKQNSSLVLRLKKLEAELEPLKLRRGHRDALEKSLYQDPSLVDSAGRAPNRASSSLDTASTVDSSKSAEAREGSVGGGSEYNYNCSPAELNLECGSTSDMKFVGGEKSKSQLNKLISNYSISSWKYSSAGDLTDLLHGGQTPPYGTFPCTLTPSTSSCNNSPSSRPKRYILAATVKREVGTQTVLDVEDLETDGPLSTSELQDVLSQVKYRNETLNKEKERLSVQIKETEEKLQESYSRYQVLSNSATICISECSTLRDQLQVVRREVEGQLAEIREDMMDTAKVIYTLHGSLSKESTVISDLCKRLKDSQTNVGRLEYEKSILKEEINKLGSKLTQYKEKLKNSSPRKDSSSGRSPKKPGIHTNTTPLNESMTPPTKPFSLAQHLKLTLQDPPVEPPKRQLTLTGKPVDI